MRKTISRRLFFSGAAPFTAASPMVLWASLTGASCGSLTVTSFIKTVADLAFEPVLIAPEQPAVAKRAPTKENAMTLLAVSTRPMVIAQLDDRAAGLPDSKTGLGMTSAEIRKWLPDLGKSNSLVLNGAFSSEDLQPVSRRYKESVLR